MNDNFPLVSCVIPVYNSALYIEKTLISVFEQTYPNIEIIVVNDGSTDSTAQIVMGFLQTSHRKTQYLENNGKGACAARNYGYRKSHGKYIQFLDADDLLGPEKIEIQVKTLLSHPKNTIASGIWGRFINDPRTVIWEEQSINKSYQNPTKWLLDSWTGKGMGQTGIWLIPKNLIEVAGGWNETLQINQDGEYLSRLIMNSAAIIYCPEAKVFYRSGSQNSISQQNNLETEKAESLLRSYQLYVVNAAKYRQLDFLKKGLGQNFLMFMYRFYVLHNDLTFIAETEFHRLGYKNTWPVGGARFRKITNVLGFKNALMLIRRFKLR